MRKSGGSHVARRAFWRYRGHQNAPFGDHLVCPFRRAPTCGTFHTTGAGHNAVIALLPIHTIVGGGAEQRQQPVAGNFLGSFIAAAKQQRAEFAIGEFRLLEASPAARALSTETGVGNQFQCAFQGRGPAGFGFLVCKAERDPDARAFGKFETGRLMWLDALTQAVDRCARTNADTERAGGRHVADDGQQALTDAVDDPVFLNQRLTTEQLPDGRGRHVVGTLPADAQRVRGRPMSGWRRQKQGIAVFRGTKWKARTETHLRAFSMHRRGLKPGVELAKRNKSLSQRGIQRVAVQDTAHAEAVTGVGTDAPRTGGSQFGEQGHC